MKGLIVHMKKLLILALAALIFMPVTKADAGYALFEQRKLMLENEMNSPRERTEQEKRKLEEKMQKVKEAEEKMSGDRTPKFNGIG